MYTNRRVSEIVQGMSMVRWVQYTPGSEWYSLLNKRLVGREGLDAPTLDYYPTSDFNLR